jgi:hypothetical protein
MSQQELLKRVVTFLHEHRIDYMVTGSYVTSEWSERLGVAPLLERLKASANPP